MTGKRKKILCVIIAFILLISAVTPFALSMKLETGYYEITSQKITKSFRIALITDLHSSDYGQNQQQLMSEISKEKPDFLALCGDIIDDELPRDKAEEFLTEASKKYSCFYVVGNHEAWTADVNGIKKIVKAYGIYVLDGDCLKVKVKGQIINICGVDDPDAYGNTQAFDSELAKCKAMMNSNYFTLFLSHRPECCDRILENGKVDLILAGHAHGGQWRLPFLPFGLYAPNQGFLPKYTQGIYNFDNGKMIVSRGLSKKKNGVPRIFNRPELVFIDVKCK